MGWPPKAKFLITLNGTHILCTGMSRFAPGLCSWKTSHKSSTEFPFSTVYFLGARGLITSSCITYDCTCSGNMDLYSMYVLHIHYIDISIWYTYISTQYINLFLMQYKCKSFISIDFHAVHSYRTEVLLLHKHFSSWLSTVCNYISIITCCLYATISESYIVAYVTNLFTFFKSAYTSNSSLVPIVFHQFFTWITLDDVVSKFYLYQRSTCF